MAMTTNQFTKNISRQVFLQAFRQRKGLSAWPWTKIHDVQTSDHATEQVFPFSGLGFAQKTGQLEPGYQSELVELDETVFTHEKATLMFSTSKENMEDGHYINIVKEGAAALADGLNAYVDYAVTNTFNRAFNSSYPVFDAVELCGTHTLANGTTTVTNKLAPLSVSYSSIYLGVNYFHGTMKTQDGLYMVTNPKYIVANPAKERYVEKVIRNTTGFEPDTGDRNTNTLGKYGLEAIYSPYLSSNYWFLLDENAKNDLLFFWRIKQEVERQADFDLDGLKVRGRVRFSTGPRSWERLVGSLGA